ncbi:MAG: hypothetical protein K2L05_08735, partial [Muribaculaceae bacterium]|nr:hypothetical protein [Muribaculaceae bacterium]
MQRIDRKNHRISNSLDNRVGHRRRPLRPGHQSPAKYDETKNNLTHNSSRKTIIETYLSNNQLPAKVPPRKKKLKKIAPKLAHIEKNPELCTAKPTNGVLAHMARARHWQCRG